MNLPDADTNRALKNLGEVSDFVRVLRWVAQSMNTDTDALMSAGDPVRVHQLQGSCRAMKDILQAARSANPSLSAYLG